MAAGRRPSAIAPRATKRRKPVLFCEDLLPSLSLARVTAGQIHHMVRSSPAAGLADIIRLNASAWHAHFKTRVRHQRAQASPGGYPRQPAEAFLLTSDAFQ